MGMLNKTQPQTRSLLVSEPFMLDPNFNRSVVLLSEHNEAGTMGWVLNQPSDLFLSDVFDDVPGIDLPLYLGGPVGQDSIQFVHKCYDKLHSGIDLGSNIYWGGDFEMLKALLLDKTIQEEEVKFFLGYSGWIPGQLDQELQENTWMINNNYH